jgi:uncharacterized protein (DUF58 family)
MPETVSDPVALFGFDGAFLRKLERLAVASRKPLAGPQAGPRRSPRRGASVEFADFRDYSAGDDFRRIDWKAYARLERLFLRLYSAEEMTTVTILMDMSASMRFGEPSKALTVARLAAILAYIGLASYDRVAVAAWSRHIDRYLQPRSGKAAVSEVWRGIASLANSPSEDTDFRALGELGRYGTRAGLAVVLSDLLTESDWQGGLRALQAAGQEVNVIQVLAPEELHPEIRGDWTLKDAEGIRGVEATISPRLLRRYAEELAAHTEAIASFCRRQGIAYTQLSTADSLDDTILTGLHRSGMVG